MKMNLQLRSYFTSQVTFYFGRKRLTSDEHLARTNSNSTGIARMFENLYSFRRPSVLSYAFPVIEVYITLRF